jgi:hypothetical protein
LNGSVAEFCELGRVGKQAVKDAAHSDSLSSGA